MSKSYYKTILGVRYDRSLLEAADEKLAVQEDARLSVRDIRELLLLAQDGRGVTETELKTLSYIHQKYRFTPKASIELFERIEDTTCIGKADEQSDGASGPSAQDAVTEPEAQARQTLVSPEAGTDASGKRRGLHIGWITILIVLLLGLPVLVLTLSEREQSIQSDVFSKWNKSVTRGNYEGFDMSGANLKGRDYTGANFKGANLKGTILQGAKLVAADFRGANLEKAVLLGADMRSADFKGANLKGAVAAFANMTGANLSGVDATGAKFQKTKLSVANFDNATLVEADFRQADLRQASMRNTDLKYANMEGANTRGADMTGSDTYFMKGGK